MNKKIKEELMNDFNETYNFEPKKQSMHNLYERKDPMERKIRWMFVIWKRISFGLAAALLLLIISVTLIFIFVPFSSFKNLGDEAITEEFEQFVFEHTGDDTLDCTYVISVNHKDNIYIFRKKYLDSNDQYIYSYFYIIKSEYTIQNTYLIINNQKISVSNDSYGIILETQEADAPVEFSIEINGKIKEYKLS